MSLRTVLMEDRSRLFALAYRMLGSVSDAEDVIQDAYVRIHDRDPAPIADMAAYVTTVVTRLAIDRLRSARHRRETYFGPWLPEPLLTSPLPDEQIEMLESVTMGFLVALEMLNPVERAVFLLREVFAYDYQAIAEIVDRSPTNCRQIASRVRARLNADRPSRLRDHHHEQDLLAAFLAALEHGKLDALERLLAEDVALWTDGGGRVRALPAPVAGASAVARLLLSLQRRAPADSTASPVWINAEPGLVLRSDDVPYAALVLESDEDKITVIRIVVNPDKLGAVTR